MHNYIETTKITIKKNYIAIVTLLLFLLNVYIFWPGALSPDSVSQYYQAKNGEYSNWHPPIFSYVWSIVLNFIDGGKGMLLFQLLMLWSSIFLLSIIVKKLTNNKAAAFVPFIGLSPQILSISGVLWKDVHLAYSLLLCTSCLLYIKIVNPSKKLNYVLKVLATLSLIYAANLRHNAILAILPVIIIYVLVFFDYLIKIKNIINKVKSLIFKLLIGLFIFYAAVPFVLNKIIKAVDLKPGYQVIIDDIYNLKSIEDINGNSTLNDTTKDYFSNLHHTCNQKVKHKTNTLWDCKGGENLYFVVTKEDGSDLRKYWIDSITEHPTEYLKYRLNIYGTFLRTSNPYIWEKGEIGKDFVNNNTKLNVALNRIVMITEEDIGIIYRHYFWLILGVALILSIHKISLFNKMKDYKNILSLITVSSLLYIVSYIPIVVVPDYRMIYWSSVSITTYSWITLIIIFVELKKKKFIKDDV